MKKFFRFVLEIFLEAIQALAAFAVNNLRNLANLIEVISPYAMYFIAYYVYNERGYAAIGGELFIPIAICIIVYFIRSLANKYGKGYTVPVPTKRFTEVSDDGEVSISYDRMQELLLYVADLEDWMERKNILK